MTGHDVTLSRWEARHLETAVLGILGRLLETRAPGRDTCPNCRALIAADHPCPICVEIRRR
jgi:recombinational DNA repair protein RecR